MQRLVLVLGGMLALFVVGQLATQATPPPTIAANSPPSHKTGLPPAASHSAPIESDAEVDTRLSDDYMSSDDFDRVRVKAEAGGEVTDEEKRAFTNELTRRVEQE